MKPVMLFYQGSRNYGVETNEDTNAPETVPYRVFILIRLQSLDVIYKKKGVSVYITDRVDGTFVRMTEFHFSMCSLPRRTVY